MKIRVFTALLCLVLIVSAVFPFPEGAWDFLSIGTSYQVGANPGWLSGWDYRKSHVINNATGAGTDYQMACRVHAQSGTDDDPGPNVYLNEHCTDFPNDIRVTDNDQETELDHFVDHVEVEYVGTAAGSTNPYPVTEPIQRKSFYANGRYWVFYVDGTNVVYKTSTDGLVWTTGDDSPIKTGVTEGRGMQVGLFYDGSLVHIAYAWYSDISYRSGTPDSDGGITWTTDWATVETEDSKAITPCVAVDTSGYCWISYVEAYGTNRATVIKSGNNDGTWGTTPGGFPYELRAGGTINYCVVVPLSSGKMLCVYADWYDYVRARRWNGSSWDSEVTTTREGDISENMSAVGDGADAHIAFQGDRNNGTYPWDIIYVRFDGTSGAFANEAVIEEQAGQLCPVISMSGSTLYLFWMGTPGDTSDRNFYYKRRISGSWDESPTTWATDRSPFYSLMRISTPYSFSDNKTGILYQTGTASPWNISFCRLTEPHFAQVAEVWVEVADDLSSGTAPIYLYYGKNGASSASDGTATFIDFDDFEYSDSPSNHGWTVGGTVVTATTHSWEYAGTRGLDCSTGASYVYLNNSPTTNIAVRVKYYDQVAGGFEEQVLGCYGAGSKWAMAAVEEGAGSTYYYYRIDGTYYSTGITRTAGWHTFEISQDGTNKKVWVDGVGQSTTVADTITTVYLGSLWGANEAHSYFDTYFIRKYVATEPSHGAWGSEETETPACSPNYYVSPISWSVNSGDPLAENSNYSTGLTYFTVTNNASGGAIDISIHAGNMTGGGFTWVLSDSGTPGDMVYGMFAGLDGGSYNITVKQTAPYIALKLGLANNASQDFGLKFYTPTNFDDGNLKTGNITLTVVCS